MTSRSTLINIPQPKTYVLDKKGNPIHEPNMAKFGAFLASDAKCLKQDTLPDGTYVSTVFTGIDYLLPPRLWETMIFGGPNDGYEQRYTSVQDALKGHERALAIATALPIA
jgi:hypothetical protein